MSQRNESYTPLLCSYPESEKINRVSEGAEAMFCRLIAKCDDAGNYHGQPKRLLCKLYALRYENGTMTLRKVARYRNELVTARLIDVYIVDRVEYIHIVDCKKSLRADVKKKLSFPEYTQTLVNKELPESVTDTGRTRNEPVTDTGRQSNPIQSNPTQYSVDYELFWKKFKGRWNPDKDRYIKVGKYEGWLEWQKLTLEEQTKAIAVADKVSGKFTPDACRWLKRKMFDDFKLSP